MLLSYHQVQKTLSEKIINHLKTHIKKNLF